MRNKVILLLILIFAIQIVASQNTALAQTKTIIVPDNYLTIQQAIEVANKGDTIFVKQGCYEGIFNQTLEINEAINLIGENKSTTTLRLSPPYVKMNIFTYEYMGYLAAVQINSNNVRIEGITIETPDGGISGKGDHIQIVGINATTGVSIEGSFANISENSVKGDLSVAGNSNVVINNRFEIKLVKPSIGCIGSNNLIANNQLAAENNESNIKLNIEGTSNIVVNNQLSGIELKGDKNIIYKNMIKAVPGSSGVYLSHSSKNAIYANKITYAESITYEQYGVFLSESHDNLIQANHIEGVFMGAYLQNTDTEPMITNNNTFYDNNFVNNQIQAWDTTSSTTNSFYNGKEGNYWSDYEGKDSNNDGIGDTPFNPTYVYTYDLGVEKITKCSPDNYPLIIPFNIDSFTVDLPEWVTISLNLLPTEAPCPTSSVPEFSAIAIVPLLLSLFFVALVIMHRKAANG